MKATNIRYVLFDLGFVLVELNGLPWFQKQYPDLSEQEIHRRWLSLNCVQEFETGNISEPEFFKQAVDALELSISPESFAIIFRNWVLGPYTQSEQLLRELKKHYRIGCLSNTNSCHIQHLNSISNFLELLDHRFYSHEIGAMKPDAQAYKTVIDNLAIPAASILFIDDSLDNVNAALQMGMQAFQAKGFDEVLDCLNTQLGFCL